MTTTAWYVLNSYPLQEQKVVDVAATYGFPTFFPKFLNIHTKNARPYALFPSYLFIAFDVTDTYWYEIYQFPGVRCILSGTGFDPFHPTPVSTHIVRAFQKLCGPTETLTNAKPSFPTYHEGQRLEITNGPLLLAHKGKKLQGIVLRNSKDRVRLLMDIIAMPVDISKEYVKEVIEA